MKKSLNAEGEKQISQAESWLVQSTKAQCHLKPDWLRTKNKAGIMEVRDE